MDSTTPSPSAMHLVNLYEDLKKEGRNPEAIRKVAFIVQEILRNANSKWNEIAPLLDTDIVDGQIVAAILTELWIQNHDWRGKTSYVRPEWTWKFESIPVEVQGSGNLSDGSDVSRETLEDTSSHEESDGEDRQESSGIESAPEKKTEQQQQKPRQRITIRNDDALTSRNQIHNRIQKEGSPAQVSDSRETNTLLSQKRSRTKIEKSRSKQHKRSTSSQSPSQLAVKPSSSFRNKSRTSSNITNELRDRKRKPPAKVKENPNKNFQCEICQVYFSTRSNLNRHIRDVHCGRSYTCEFCERNYNSKRSLEDHKKNTHPLL